ncbi:MAG TPA: TIM barrel protein, partial [Pseudomonadales bacterium]|nr:TIM barrel protein [Pseudomonadales bacterium]
MKFCANLTLLYNEVPFLERFALAAADGFKAIEIQFPYDTPIVQIQQQLLEHDLRCVLINVPAGDLMQGGEGLASVPAKTAEYTAGLVECISYALALKVEFVNVLAGRCLDEDKRVFYLDTFYKNLLKTAETFERFGIKTTFEAINTRDMPGFLISTTDHILTTLKEVNHPYLKAQFDVYHMALMAQDVEGFISEHAEYIGHIQFADIPDRGEPGSGKLNFPAVFKAIMASSYEGWMAAEYKPTME